MAEILSQLENGLGLEIILWFQSWRTPGVQTFFELITHSGSTIFFLLVLPAVYWCWDTALGRRVVILFSFSVWFTQWLKEWWQRPRPAAISPEVQAAVDAPDFGIPSGHALIITALWGAIAWHVRRRWVIIVAIIYVFLVSLSRMVLGVHFPQDVVAGLILGLLLLATYVWLEPSLSAWFSGQGIWKQIGLVVGTSALLLVIHPLIFPDRSGYGLRVATGSVGVLLGGGIGFVIEAHFLGMDAGGTWWKRVLRYLLGIFVLFLVFFGLDSAFAQLTPVYLFTFIQSSAVGLWVSYGAPWLFVKTSLVD